MRFKKIQIMKMDTLSLKAKTRQILADEYGICVKTLNHRLEKANIVIEAGILFPKTLNTIYKTLGVPKYPNKS